MLLIYQEFRELIKHRELLFQMTSREIKSRYKQSILGYFWVVLNPLIQMLVMSFAFSVILRIPTNASSNIPYTIFLYTALLPWSLFTNTLSSTTSSLVNNSSLITKIYFPRTIFPISTTIAKTVDFFFASSIYIVYLLVYHIPIGVNIFWIVPIFIIQQLFTLGLSLFFSAANLLYRDIQYLLVLVLTLWMYITPVVYPADIVPPNYKVLFQLNPMAVIINAYRQTILAGGSPNYFGLAVAFIVSISTLYLGLAFFKNRERIFADNI